MNRTVAATAIVLAVVIAGFAIGLTVSDDGETWTIEYVLNGGSNPDDAPSSYSEGTVRELPKPVRDGFIFGGWYTDAGLQDRIQSISADTKGDLKLYAKWIEGQEYNISYILNGGTLAEDSPMTYISGNDNDLGDATRDGYKFGGWYFDEAFDDPVVVVGDDVVGDVTLYACWVDEDQTGKAYTWDVTGTYMNGMLPHRMSGTIEQRNIAFKDGETYYETARSITYTYLGGSFTDDSVEGSWTGENMVTIYYLYNEVVNGYSCTVWDDRDGSTYWLYHMDVQVKISYTSGSTTITYVLSSISEFEPQKSFEPDVTTSYPVRVEGAGTCNIGDSVSFEAVGDGFTGWYVDGELVTQDRTLTIDRIDPDTKIVAKTDVPYIVMGESASLSDYGFDDATVTDSDGNKVSSDISTLSPGIYMAKKSASGYIECLSFFIDGVKTFTQTWEYSGKNYTISTELKYSDVYRYDYDHPYKYRISMSDKDYVTVYHTVQDPYLIKMVSDLRSMSEGMSDLEYATFVLKFVQTVPYLTDDSVYGVMEYWAYPLEYLWNGGGDCEDSTIFYDTLMMISGYDAAMMVFYDHAMSALSVEGASGFFMKADDDTHYYFCETTSTGYDIGQSANSRKYSPSTVYFWYPIENTVKTETV